MGQLMRIKCQHCKKRDAVYRRLASGEVLCVQCLANAVVKQIRKAMSVYPIVKRDENVLYVIRSDKPLESITALKLFLKAVSGLNVSIDVLCIDVNSNGLCNTVEEILKRQSLEVRKIISITVKHKNIVNSWLKLVKLHSVLPLQIARKEHITAIVQPYFRDELTFLNIIGLIMLKYEVFSEGMPVKKSYYEDIRISRPFYYVVSHDIAVLTYHNKILQEYMIKNDIGFIPIDERESYALELSKRIFFESPELMYASTKSVELLQSYIVKNSTQCSYCLSLASESVCSICKSLIDVLESSKTSV